MLDSKLQTLTGYLLKHRGGPGFGSGRLKGAELESFEQLMDEVKLLLRAEAGGEAPTPVSEVSVQRRALFKATAEGLTRLADGQEVSLNDLVRKVDNVKAVLLSIVGRAPEAAAPAAAAERES